MKKGRHHTPVRHPVRRNLAACSVFFEKIERFLETAPLEIVGELGIDRRGEAALEIGDLLRKRAKPIKMSRGVAGIKFAVGDDREPFPERGGQSLKRGNGLGHGGKNSPAWRGAQAQVFAAFFGFLLSAASWRSASNQSPCSLPCKPRDRRFSAMK